MNDLFPDTTPGADRKRSYDGDSMTGGHTNELMHGSQVRILVLDGTPPEVACRHLEKARRWIEKSPTLLEEVDLDPDSEIPL